MEHNGDVIDSSAISLPQRDPCMLTMIDFGIPRCHDVERMRVANVFEMSLSAKPPKLRRQRVQYKTLTLMRYGPSD